MLDEDLTRLTCFSATESFDELSVVPVCADPSMIRLCSECRSVSADIKVVINSRDQVEKQSISRPVEPRTCMTFDAIEYFSTRMQIHPPIEC